MASSSSLAGGGGSSSGDGSSSYKSYGGLSSGGGSSSYTSYGDSSSGGGSSSYTSYGDNTSYTSYGIGGSSSSSTYDGGISSYSPFAGGCSSSSLSPPQDVAEAMVKLTLTSEVEAEEYNAGADQTVVLWTSDGVEFKVRLAAASLCKTVRRLIDDDSQGRIPLVGVHSSILSKVLDYCNKHVDWSTRPTPLKLWDAEYVKALVADLDMLRRVLLAAHFLEVDGLLQLLTKAVAGLIRRKSPEEIRQTFKIKKDFTPEQEEEVRQRFGWAVEEE